MKILNPFILAALMMVGTAHADQLRTIDSTKFFSTDNIDPDTGDLFNPNVPYLYVSNSLLIMLPGSLGIANPGISATNITLGPSDLTCDSAHNGTITRASGGLVMCNGSSFDTIVSGSTVSVIQTQMAGFVTSSTLNTQVSSLTTAVNAKVATATYTGGISSLTTAVNGKFAQPTGTTSQYLRGDGSLATFPTLTRTFTTTTRTLNTAFQPSTTNDTSVSYQVDIAVTSALLAGASGSVVLEYADNSGMSMNVVTIATSTTSTGGVLNISNIGTAAVNGMIPANKWVRIRTVNNAATPTFTYRTGQEVTLP